MYYAGNYMSLIHGYAASGNLIGLQGLLLWSPSLLNERSIPNLDTPLHMAAAYNRVEIVKCLFEWRGQLLLELDAKNFYGETPLHTASRNGCNETVKMLLGYGANIEARTNNGMTPLHYAVSRAILCRDNSTVNILLENNANCWAQDNAGRFPSNYIPSVVGNEELLIALQHKWNIQQIYNRRGAWRRFIQVRAEWVEQNGNGHLRSTILFCICLLFVTYAALKVYI